VSSYIFAGENTSEVRSAALKYAKSLNCEENSSEGCACLSCRIFDNLNHPDTFFVKATKQNGIGVEDIREQIIMPMSLKPFKYKYKIFIIESPLTPAAQNALLKTIEEPAPYGVFLFLAESTHGFLPTVLSRCIVKKFQNGVLVQSSQSHEIQALSEEIANSVQGADITETFALYRKVEHLEKNDLHEFLNSLYIHFGKKLNVNAVSAISKTKQILSQNGNTRLAIELMLMKMR